MLVTTTELASHLNDPTWVIFDCRHDLVDHGKGPKLYAEGHVAGAYLRRSRRRSPARNGEERAAPVAGAGGFCGVFGGDRVTAATQIVAYDDAGGLYAARLWWLARWIGLTQVALLDGGWQKWTAEARAVSAVVPVAKPAAKLTVKVDTAAVWGAGDVLRQIGNPDFALIDARAAERYRG